MAGTRLEYQIVGRYMDGKEVTGYHLQCLSNGKNDKYTKEQVCFLVGRGQVSNCSGQIYQDKVLLRGVGISLEDLPVQQEKGGISRTDGVGKVRKGASAADVMTQFMLTHAIVSGRNTIGYIVSNAGGGTAKISRAQLLELAKAGRIGNARYQESNGKPILRGVGGVNLNQLPTVSAEELGMVPAKAAAPAKAAPAKASAPKAEKKEGQADGDGDTKRMIAEFKKYAPEGFKQFNKGLGNTLEIRKAYDSYANGTSTDGTLVVIDCVTTMECRDSLTLVISLKDNTGFKYLEAYASDGMQFSGVVAHINCTGNMKADMTNLWNEAYRELHRVHLAPIILKDNSSSDLKDIDINELSPRDKKLLESFRHYCLKSYLAVNGVITNKFAGDGSDSFSSDFNPENGGGVMCRFDFNVAGSNAGGWIELSTPDFSDLTNRIITFYAKHSNGQVDKREVDLKTTKFDRNTFINGWKWIVKSLNEHK